MPTAQCVRKREVPPELLLSVGMGATLVEAHVPRWMLNFGALLEASKQAVGNIPKDLLHSIEYNLCQGLCWTRYAIQNDIRAIAHIIEEAQTAFLNDPTSTDPTHTQLAKDHDDHPLHVLAAELAMDVVRRVGTLMRGAWERRATADQVAWAALESMFNPLVPGERTEWQNKLVGRVDAWAKTRNGKARIEWVSTPSWLVERTEWARAEWKKRLQKVDSLLYTISPSRLIMQEFPFLDESRWKGFGQSLGGITP